MNDMDSENNIIKRCASGMEQEGLGEQQKAAELFNQAWAMASTDYEKAIAAHYVARHQPDVRQKLNWDVLALKHAECSEEDVKGFFPSLYLNIAKGYEDLGEKEHALHHYHLALGCVEQMGDDGYAKMIRAGIEAGIKRVSG
ncbi:MAG: rRNA adenine methyltransferase [Bacteroidota bacterium]